MRRGLSAFATRVAIGAIAAAAAVVLAHDMRRGFYEPAAAAIAGAPGTLIRDAARMNAPFSGVTAYRILYRSTDPSGATVPVSGVVLIPRGAAPAAGRPVLAWAHPTTGVAQRCAPSVAPLAFDLMPGLRDLLQRGYVVVATDYPGLGPPGTHPYLVGESEGHAVLDAVRAVRAMPEADAGTRFALWGHSQGGHAAIYASLLVASYAPELDLVGLALAAPATDIGELVREDAGTPAGNNLTAMTLWAWSRYFGHSLDSVVDPGADTRIDALSAYCIDTVTGLLARRGAARAIDAGFLSVEDVTAVEPWATIVTDNTPGTTPAGVPVFVAQGDADELIHPGITATYVASLCAAGRSVTILDMPGVNHGNAGFASAGTAVPWIAARFDGGAATNDCPAPP